MIQNIFTNTESDWTIGCSMKRLTETKHGNHKLTTSNSYIYRQLKQFISLDEQLEKAKVSAHCNFHWTSFTASVECFYSYNRSRLSAYMPGPQLLTIYSLLFVSPLSGRGRAAQKMQFLLLLISSAPLGPRQGRAQSDLLTNTLTNFDRNHWSRGQREERTERFYKSIVIRR